MNSEVPVVTTSESGCVRCGAVIAPGGQQRHDAWHDFVESSIAGLTADLAPLLLPRGE